MFWVPYRRCPQLSVNGSLNQHMAKQVPLFQTPVKTWLPMLANQRQPHRDMAIAGTACSPEGHPAPDQLCSYMSLLHTVPDTAVFWTGKRKINCTIGKKAVFFFPHYKYFDKSRFKMPLKCRIKLWVLYLGKYSWLGVNTAKAGIFTSMSHERYGLFVAGESHKEYRQGNLCNLFTGPSEAHKDEWDQGQLLFSHSSPNLYW